MKKLRVGVIYGGRSGEHEVSLASAAAVFANLDPSRYDAVPIRIEKDGRWMLPDRPPSKQILRGEWSGELVGSAANGAARGMETSSAVAAIEADALTAAGYGVTVVRRNVTWVPSEGMPVVLTRRAA